MTTKHEAPRNWNRPMTLTFNQKHEAPTAQPGEPAPNPQQSPVMVAFRQECDDVDRVLRMLQINPSAVRTEGGRLNVPKIREIIATHEAAAQMLAAKIAEQAARIAELEAEWTGMLVRGTELTLENTALTAQRDRLVEALKNFTSINLASADIPANFAWFILQARAVLAEIEKEESPPAQPERTEDWTDATKDAGCTDESIAADFLSQKEVNALMETQPECGEQEEKMGYELKEKK